MKTKVRRSEVTDKYITWIDKQIAKRKEIYASIERNSPKVPDPLVEFHDVGIASLLALRAVVELHKPDMRGNCDICSWIIGKPSFVHYSACPTIQAIEKELG